MIGISHISYVLGKNRIDTLEHAKSIGAPENLVKQKIGALSVYEKGADEDTSDLAGEACEKLFKETGMDRQKIECVILVTQNPDGHGLPHTSAIVHEKLGLTKSCAMFDISLGCSGYVYALSVMTGFMESNGFENCIILTADPYSKVVDKSDNNTSLLFCDAASASLINRTPKWRIGAFDFGTDGSQHDSLKVQDNDHLYMNGRSIFSFSATQVPVSINNALSKNNMILEDVDKIVLHQASRYLVETIAKRMQAEDKIDYYAEGYGNTVSSSIPIVLSSNIGEDEKTVLISGFGVGLSWATTVLHRTKN